MKLWRIYKYTNTVNGQSYVGQTTRSVNDRAKNGYGYRKGTAFRDAIDKYGWENFEQSILRLCTSKEEADFYEQYFIEKYNTVWPNGYNLASGGRHCIMCELTRNKMSEVNKGEGNPMYGRTGIDSPNYGKHPTEETRKKLSEALLGENNPMYGTHRRGEAAPNYGKHWWNNGLNEICAFECPEGFVPGRTPWSNRKSS